MRIKKFICLNCGAPKINEYKSPYVVCDYCGSFTDIDYTLGLDFWKESPEKTQTYQLKKIELYNRMQYAIQKKDTNEYRGLQYEFWDYYYRTFPEYLPPSIDSDGKYKLYLDICSDSSTKYAFDPKWGNKGAELNQLQQKLTYYRIGSESKVNSTGFFEMARFYIDYTKEGMRDFYESKENEIMYELLPPDIHLKMKLSMFVQIWLPYLTEEDADRFLKMTGFKLQYMDIEKPAGKKDRCVYCKSDIFVPEGSYKVYCENCHKKNVVQAFFICSSCGAESEVPDNPAKPINCGFCGTENRLIKPLFG